MRSTVWTGAQRPFGVRTELARTYRGLAATANVFAREVHMDKLARLAALDPPEFP